MGKHVILRLCIVCFVFLISGISGVVAQEDIGVSPGIEENMMPEEMPEFFRAMIEEQGLSPEEIGYPPEVDASSRSGVFAAEEAAIVESSSQDGLAVGREDRLLDLLDIKGLDILDVLKLISQKSGLNIIASQNVRGPVTLYLKKIKVLDALKVIVSAYGWAFIDEDQVIKVMTAQEFEQRYGYKFGREMEIRIKQLFFAKPENVTVLLNEVKSNQGKIAADAKSGTLVLQDDPSAIDQMIKIIDRVDVPIHTQVFRLNYAKAEDLKAHVEEVLTPDVGSVKADERSNTLVVMDTKRKLEDVAAVVKAFDQKDKEVLIEAKIVQVTLNNAHKMGIDWEAVVQRSHDWTLKSAFDLLTKDSDGKITSGGSVSVGTFADDQYEVLLEALDTVGETNVLSSPRITTLNNKEAKILVGSSEPYVTSQTTTTSSGPTTTAESVTFIEVGIKLYVTPQIHDDDFITMNIKPEISEVTERIATGSQNEIPVVQTSEAETTVTVKNGVTLVIGGLMKDYAAKDVKRVPLLGDIPLLGYAFRSESESTEKTELVIFLKPTIITGDLSVSTETDADIP